MKKKISVIILLFLFIIAAVFYIDATIIEPKRLHVRYETLSNELIPEQMDDVTILYFSDIHFGKYVDEERFKQIIDSINQLVPDVIIFGGDIFDEPALSYPNAQMQNKTIELLSSLNAPLGKFAILGDSDTQNDMIKQRVIEILNESEFEVLNNQCIKLRNGKTQSINLVGISSSDTDSAFIDSTFDSVSSNEYTIAVVHDPSLADNLSSNSIHLLLGAHTMGGQLNIPFFRLKINRQAKYIKGKHKINSMLLDITSGTGLTQFHARLFSDSEIVFYRLKHVDVANSSITNDTENNSEITENQSSDNSNTQ